MRDRDVDDRGNARDVERAADAAGQPGPLRAERHTAVDRDDADTGDRDMNIDFPFHFDARQQTAATTDDDHIRDLIEQLLLTGPGERVNRPNFGGGLQQLVFAEQPGSRPRCSSWSRATCSST